MLVSHPHELVVCPLKGYLTRKLDVFSENDAYIDIEMGSQVYHTSVKLNEEVPTWDEQFVIKSEGKNLLKFKVMDRDQLLDQLIGEGTLDLQPYFKKNEFESEAVFVKLHYEGEPAGKLLVKVKSNKKSQYRALKSQQKRPELISNVQMKFYDPTKHHDYKIDLQINTQPFQQKLPRPHQPEEEFIPPPGIYRNLHVPLSHIKSKYQKNAQETANQAKQQGFQQELGQQKINIVYAAQRRPPAIVHNNVYTSNGKSQLTAENSMGGWSQSYPAQRSQNKLAETRCIGRSIETYPTTPQNYNFNFRETPSLTHQTVPIPNTTSLVRFSPTVLF